MHGNGYAHFAANEGDLFLAFWGSFYCRVTANGGEFAGNGTVRPIGIDFSVTNQNKVVKVSDNTKCGQANITALVVRDSSLPRRDSEPWDSVFQPRSEQRLLFRTAR